MIFVLLTRINLFISLFCLLRRPLMRAATNKSNGQRQALIVRTEKHKTEVEMMR